MSKFGLLALLALTGCVGRDGFQSAARALDDGDDDSTTPGDTEGGSGDSGSADSGSGDDGSGDSGVAPVLDWRVMSSEQWQIVSMAMAEAAAAGSNRPVSVTRLGAGLSGSAFKFGGTVLGANGKIYAIPFQKSQVYEITLTGANPQISAVGPTFDVGSRGWCGGALGSNGVIYGVPYNGTEILRIDTLRDPVIIDTFPFVSSQDGKIDKWCSATRADDGKIYMFPNESATTMLVVDPSTQPPTVSEIAIPSDPGSSNPDGNSAGRRWCAGGVSPTTGTIYGVPALATR
ncbi:MAG: hypothetical protein H7Z43_03290, partial [Clostridia bacterium]|nr:hypothetical protein [Deltaproteobacteria bacterium]